jgi:gas vesicle protein
MKKLIIGAGLFAAGVILENKYDVQEKTTDLAKKVWKWVVEKVDNLKEDVKENIDNLKEEVSE